MLHKILNLKGVEEIEKEQQQKINGGRAKCFNGGICTSCGHHCAEVQCCYCDDF
ncbi:hypothetical protein [uncultured Kordia sp.]|uniref:hypothetical protein n=1 Tax=uncultured Kordia sp. TaxID=507699 RepID=UPI00261DDE95|nr:hypothetical protein [uncultured Kordia sp.]